MTRRASFLPVLKGFSTEQLLEASQQTTVIEEVGEGKEEVMGHFAKPRRQSSMAVSLTPDVLNALVNNAQIAKRRSGSISSVAVQETQTSVQSVQTNGKTSVQTNVQSLQTSVRSSTPLKKTFTPLARPQRKRAVGVTGPAKEELESVAEKEICIESDEQKFKESDKEASKDTDKELHIESDKETPKDTDKQTPKDTEKQTPKDTEKHIFVEPPLPKPIVVTSTPHTNENNVTEQHESDEDLAVVSEKEDEEDASSHSTSEDERDASSHSISEDASSHSISEDEAETTVISKSPTIEPTKKKQVKDAPNPTLLRRSARIQMMESISFKPIGSGTIDSKRKRLRKSILWDYVDTSSEEEDQDEVMLDNEEEEHKELQQEALTKNRKRSKKVNTSLRVKKKTTLEKFQEQLGGCTILNYKKRPTLESPHVLQIKDTGKYDEQGRIIISPEDLPQFERNNCPFVLENGDIAVIDPQKFTIEYLCNKNFYTGEKDEEFGKFEEARIERRRKREALYSRKKRARKNGYSVREIETIKKEAEGESGVSENVDIDSLIDVKTQPAAPQLIMVDGQFVLESTEVDRHQLAESAFNGPDGDTRVREVVNRYNEFFNSATYSKHKRAENWSRADTNLFYEGLSTFGTDFSILAGMFPGRTRRNIRNKFKHEEKHNPTMVELALMRRLPIGLDAYSAISGQGIHSLNTIEQEIKDIDEKYRKETELEIQNKEKARMADSTRAMEEDQAAFGVSAPSMYKEVRTSGRKSKAQLRKELRQNEEVLGSIDMMAT